MMPVYNGELFLAEALDSLLAQSYSNFEIIILDNQSTDGTARICGEYSRKDGRIRFIVDQCQRNPHEAANRLSELITGEYCMIACDDDVWDPDYVASLVSALRADGELGMAYSNGCYIDVDGNRGRRALLTRSRMHLRSHSRFGNFARYLMTRRVLPIVFGVFRSDVYVNAIPFETFDETIADVDNHFMLKVFSSTRVHCEDRILFYYRNKFRWADPGVLRSYPKRGEWIRVWWYDAKHQFRFCAKVIETISGSPFSPPKRVLLGALTWVSFLYYMGPVRLRSFAGRLLARAGLREGASQRPDVAAEIRHEALVKDRTDDVQS